MSKELIFGDGLSSVSKPSRTPQHGTITAVFVRSKLFKNEQQIQYAQLALAVLLVIFTVTTLVHYFGPKENPKYKQPQYNIGDTRDAYYGNP